jgi:PAS domain S-box-containing protein
MNTHRQTERRTAHILILIFVLLAAGIVTAGSLYYRDYQEHYRARVESQISAIADLKVGELVQFRKERLADAAILFRNVSFSAQVRRFLENPRNADAQRQIQAWIGKYQAHYQYDRASLLGTRGVERVSAPAGPEPVAAIVSRRASEILRSGLVSFQDFYRDEHNQRICLAVLVPIFDERAGSRPLGVLVLRIDPGTYLYPFISRWPIPSRTAETLLVRRDGNDALFLNELRFRTGTALNLRFPLTASELPPVQAALGREGLVKGVDYRGVPVIAHVRRVPDSPWFLSARMDVSEVYAPLRERLWAIAGLAGILLLGAAGATGFLWRQQSMRSYREHRASEALRESEERYRLLFETSGEAIFVTAEDGVVLSANPEACRILGRGEAEIRRVGRNAIVDLNDPRLAPALAERKRTGRFAGELNFVRKDGTVFPAEVSVVVFKDSAGHSRASSIVRDITERKRAEEALRASEERHRTILQTAMDGFWLTDTQERLLDVNESYCRMSGYSARELLAMRIPDLEANETASDTAAHIQEVLARGEDRFESRHRRKDGSVIDLEISVQYRPAEGGRLVAFLRDITARKRAGEALRESEHRYRSLFEQSGDSILLLELRDGPPLILDANQTALRVHGYSLEEMVGQPISLLEPGISREAVEERSRLTAEGKPMYMRHRRKDGSEFDVESVARRAQIGGRNAFLAVERDITERKRAEEEREKLLTQLAQAQKMESIGRLAGGIAHDFNNLLTVINGYSLLLLGKLNAADPLRAGLQEIHKAGERAAGLTLQLLAFSRKQVLEPRVLDLNHEVDQMRSMLERLVGEDVEVRVELSAQAGSVHADPHQLEQVIMNLVVNARDAMPHGGKLLIETAGLELDERYVQSHPEAHAGRHVLLAVSDSGVGMDDETRRRIFEPFFTTKGLGKGTGLGLSMVEGIVAQSGGHIEVYSEPGHGTTFKVYLPKVEEAAAGSQPEAALALGGKETVLVVEDQPEVREYAVTVLKAYGYQVIQAESAGQALSLFERERGGIHLVLTDVVMPKVSGRELANRLEKLQPGIKVLFMSGYTDNVIVHHGVLEEGAQFIQKPFSPERLAARVREVLGPP